MNTRCPHPAQTKSSRFKFTEVERRDLLQSFGMFKGLEHTAIASPNPKQLAEWYAEHLEFRINFVYDGNYFVRAQNGSMLEIIPSIGERSANEMRTLGGRGVSAGLRPGHRIRAGAAAGPA